MGMNCMCFKWRYRFFLLLPLLLFFSLPVHAASVLDGFNPNVDGTVYTSAAQADGKLLVGGDFTTIGGQAKSNIARLNADGTVDTTFTADANGDIYSIIVESDGQILVGGAFTTVGGETRNRIARLNNDGSVDSTFAPQANDIVRTIALLLNGDIIIGGDFTTINSEERKYIARLSGDNGSLDPDYTPDANGSVYSLATQRNGKVIAGGDFTTIGGQAREHIARLNDIDGSAETTLLFDIAADGAVRSILIQIDDKILIGGDFTTLTDSNGIHNRNRIALLDADGDTDFNFDPNANGIVRSIVLQTDGKVLVGGDFTSMGGTLRNHMARLNLEFGAVDESFTPNVNGIVHTITVPVDDKIVIGGEFTSLAEGGITHNRNYLARLYIDGSVDADFISNSLGNNGSTAAISAIAIQGDGKYLIGGLFSHINGIERGHIARLHPNGSVDTTWHTSVDGEVTSIVIQSNGKILICGDFNNITADNGSFPKAFLAQLNDDGTVDDTFSPVTDGPVYAIVEESNGNILLAGDFTTITSNNIEFDRSFLARLLTDLSYSVQPLDQFNPNPDGIVRTIATQTDGKILIGGDFTRIGGGASSVRSRMARLSTNGESDSTFDPNANGAVRTIVVQPDGHILVGGDFTYIGNQTRNGIARLYGDSAKADHFNPNANASVRSIALQADGKILAIGDFTNIGAQSRNHIARLEPIYGTADDFNPVIDPGDSVSAISLQKDGKIVVGGDFTAIDAQPKNMMARLSADSAALQEFTLSTDGKTITWLRKQSSPEVHDVVFYESANFDEYANNTVWDKIDAAATRIVDGWELEIPPGILFHQQNRYLAVSAKTSGGFTNGSTSSIQSVIQYFVDDKTLTITPQPTDGRVTSDLEGIDCGEYGPWVYDNCLYTYQADTLLTLTATPIEYGYVAFDGRSDYVFTQWGGLGNDCGTGMTNPLPVLMDENRTCSANFAMAYVSLLAKAGNGNGTVDWDPINRIDGLDRDDDAEGEVYASGTTALVTAVADDDSIFTGWSGDCSGDIGSFELFMDADKTCTANFEPKRTLTMTSIGNGVVTGAGDFAIGTTVELTAIPDDGYFFIGWTGDCTGMDNPLFLLMDENKTCNANFDASDVPLPPQSSFSWNMFLPAIINQQSQPQPGLERILTVNLLTGTGTVTSSDNFINCPAENCSHIYNSAETVTLTAVPSNGDIIFTGWFGTSGTDINCPGTGPCTLSMDSNKDIYARFYRSSSW